MALVDRLSAVPAHVRVYIILLPFSFSSMTPFCFANTFGWRREVVVEGLCASGGFFVGDTPWVNTYAK